MGVRTKNPQVEKLTQLCKELLAFNVGTETLDTQGFVARDDWRFLSRRFWSTEFKECVANAEEVLGESAEKIFDKIWNKGG